MLLKIPTRNGWTLVSEVIAVDHGETDFEAEVPLNYDHDTGEVEEWTDSFGALMAAAGGYGSEAIFDIRDGKAAPGYQSFAHWIDEGFKWVIYKKADTERRRTLRFYDRDATAYLMNDDGQTIHQM